MSDDDIATYVGYKGYTIYKENISVEEQQMLRKDLNVKPFVPKSSLIKPQAFPVYRESKKKIYTVLKSPHVNKKSKEQFQSKKYQAILHIIFKNNKITKILHLKILKFLNLGKKNLFLPLQIKVLEKVII